MVARVVEWQKLPVSLTELCIDTTLRCGQSFRWRKSAEDEWSCALHGRILSFRQDSSHLFYRAVFSTAKSATPLPVKIISTTQSVASVENDDTLALVKHYFNLGYQLDHLYSKWASADPNFAKRAPKFTGVRILRQDPWEALIGFICSSNNNISRISAMVQNLCKHYGPLIGYIGEDAYHDFPTPESLANPQVEAHLMKLGFGYRARYIYKTAKMVSEEKGLDWLASLANPENPPFGIRAKGAGELLEGGREGYRKAHEELLALHGVGPKVADCVCLMGLGWSESVPVDTHVWQIAQRDYKFGKGKHSSLTAATYSAIANHFRKLWGKEAGWAHSVLFTADLKTFSKRSVTKIELREDEEVAVKQQETSSKVVQEVVKTERMPRKRNFTADNENYKVVELETRSFKKSKRRKA